MSMLLFAYLAGCFLAAGVEVIDDAYISFRYAKHLIEGDGLVFNPGQAPVQGYTNFLWTVLMALAMAVGCPPVTAAVGLGFAAGLVVTMLTALWSERRLAPGLMAVAVAPALLVSNLGFVVWSIRGLETGFFTALVLVAAWLAVRSGPSRPLPSTAAMIFALSALTRPEGVLFFFLTVVHLGLCRWRSGGAPFRRADLRALGLFSLVLGVYAIWTTLYYGDLLPNTFYAKVGGPLVSLPRGVRYLLKFARPRPVGLVNGTGLVLLVLPFAFLKRTRTDWTRSYAFLMVAGMSLYVAMVGGDVFPAYRFLVPILPFFYLLVGDGIAALEERGRQRAAGGPAAVLPAAVVAGLLTCLVLQSFSASSVFAWREWRRGNQYTSDMRMVGRWLKRHERPGTWVAVNPSGALSYESELPVIDMLGLNDAEIAHTPVQSLGTGRLAGHEKGNGASVFRRRPEIILIGGVHLKGPLDSRPWGPHGRSERELSRLPGLNRVYRLESAEMPDGRTLSFLRRRRKMESGEDDRP
ncbi:MAG: hypothetical protein ACE5ID_09485 [Acidobacteriota bacterium]